MYLPLLYTEDGGGGDGGATAAGGTGGVDEDRQVANEADGFLQR